LYPARWLKKRKWTDPPPEGVVVDNATGNVVAIEQPEETPERESVVERCSADLRRKSGAPMGPPAIWELLAMTTKELTLSPGRALARPKAKKSPALQGLALMSEALDPDVVRAMVDSERFRQEQDVRVTNDLEAVKRRHR